MNRGFKNALTILFAGNSGKSGGALLLAMISISLYALVIFPLDFGDQLWSNPARWIDNPRSVPPVWINLLPGHNRNPHLILKPETRATMEGDDGTTVIYHRITTTYEFETFPTSLTLNVSDIRFKDYPPQVTLGLIRPDGTSLNLYNFVPPSRYPGEAKPLIRYDESSYRALLSSNQSVIRNLKTFYATEYETPIPEPVTRDLANQAMFGRLDETTDDEFRIFPGQYQFILKTVTFDPGDSIGSVEIIVGGSVFGLMGSDTLGRDLALGLLFGFPVALAIGILASLSTSIIGASLGIISGYLGGWTDIFIQRLADVFSNIPVLPILIFLVFVFGSNLFLIIGILVVFSWPSLTIMIRSMVLQIRSGQFVEAARVLGASPHRIMMRHIFPQTAPFVFAQMIFFAPAAILAEAGLSFLGLGDASIPTWGQILEQGFRTGAVYLGYWWWILPPGLLIILTAITFALLAFAMEPVVNPKLKDSY